MFLYIDKKGVVSMRSDGRLGVDPAKFTEVEIDPTQEESDNFAANIRATYVERVLTFAPKDEKKGRASASLAGIRADLAKNNPNLVEIIGRLCDMIETGA